jgi:signal transduction histidine kinase/signal recognition particle receptor subunit beta
MSLINLRDRTINAKIVYYGTALSGKTTSLQHVHSVVDPEGRTELVSLNTEGDRTLFFDFLPIPLGNLGGFEVKLQAFTVPGQVKYAVTRRYVLRGADAVVFVVDSRPEAFEDNIAAVEGLRENLIANGLDPEALPLLFQWNKRDVPQALDEMVLSEALNWRRVPELPTVATVGTGVFESFKRVCCDLLEGLAHEYRIAEPDQIRSQLEQRLVEIQDEHARRRAPDRARVGARAAPLLVPEAEEAADARASVIQVEGDHEGDTPDIEELLEQAVETNMESARLVADLNETRRRLSDHVRQLATLHETGVLISSELDAKRVIDRILDEALATVGARHGSVVLRDLETTRLTVRLVRGYGADPIVRAGTADRSFVEPLLDGEPFVLLRDQLPPRVDADDDEPAPALALVAPLVHQGDALGALIAYLPTPRRDGGTQARLRFLSAVANQASVAIVNTRLFARIEGFNRELERKVAERTRELESAYRELQAMDALKDDFLASMSHELLTPLTSIRGFAEILATTAGDSGDAAEAERREFSAIVQQETARLTGMLQAVLDLSALEADQVAMARTPLDLPAVIRDAHKVHRDAFRDRDVRVRVRVEDDLPAPVGDAAWLGRVMGELLSNACKFSPEGASVVVTARRSGDEVLVEVEDQGPGVPDALRPSIFQKFKQLGDVLTDKPSGMGLGLPTAALVMKRLGGRIWMATADSGGAVFGLALPTVTSEPHEAPEEAAVA